MTSYRDIADAIAERILNQELEQGSRLPSVRQLADDHGVSTKTAHAAVRELQARGLVSSHQGGTIVSAHLSVPTPAERLQRELAGFGPLRFRERVDITYAGWAGDKSSSDWYVQHIPIAVWDALELAQDTPVARREFVTWYRKKLISLTVSWHPPHAVELVPALLQPEPILEGTIAALRAAGVQLGEAQSHFMARPADEREARLMQIDVDSPVMAVVSLRTDADNKPVEYVENVYQAREILSVGG
jgi:DNA-binding GntR family transcriptional regulator